MDCLRTLMLVGFSAALLTLLPPPNYTLQQQMIDRCLSQLPARENASSRLPAGRVWEHSPAPLPSAHTRLAGAGVYGWRQLLVPAHPSRYLGAGR